MCDKRIIHRGEHMRKKRGFTLIEMLVVLAILSILLLMAVPNLKGVFEYNDKQLVQLVDKALITAVDYWSKDNINPTQIPANIDRATNSQGKKVYDYIQNDEIYNFTNYKKKAQDTKEVEKKNDSELEDMNKMVKIDFENGILNLTFVKDGREYDDFKVEHDLLLDEKGKKRDLKESKDINLLIEGDFKEFKFERNKKIMKP